MGLKLACPEAEPILKFKVSFLRILDSGRGGSRRNSVSPMGLKLRTCLIQRETTRAWVGVGWSGLQSTVLEVNLRSVAHPLPELQPRGWPGQS